MTRDEIIAVARSWLGTPYRHQASVKGVGCDCLGLIRGVYVEVMGREPETPPPYSRDWAESSGIETMLEAAGRHLTPVAPAKAAPGDVLVFRLRPGCVAKHSGLITEVDPATGPARMIHAQEGAPVCEISLSPWWRRRIAGVFRFPRARSDQTGSDHAL